MYESLVRGCVAPLRLRSTKDEVRSLLGEPWQESSGDEYPSSGTEEWKYGDLRLTFRDGRLVHVVVCVFGKASLDLPENVGIEILGGKAPQREAVLSHLADRGMSVVKDDSLTFDFQLAYRSGSGSLVFMRDSDLLEFVSFTVESDAGPHELPSVVS